MDQVRFHLAAKNGDLPTVLYFLDELKIDPNITMEMEFPERIISNITALELAVEALQVEIVKALLDRGANPNLENGDGETPTVVAISLIDDQMSSEKRRKLYSMIDELLKHGADPNYTNAKGQTQSALIFALDDQEIFDLLIHNGADPTIADNRGYQALHYAIVRNDLKKIKTLIEAGAGPVQLSNVDISTIIYLEENRLVRGPELERWVLPETKALAATAIPVEEIDPTIVDQDGNSNLLYAVAFNYPYRVDKYLETLSEMYPTDNLKDQMKLWSFIQDGNRDGNTPLHYAVVAENPITVYLLVHFGFDRNQANNEGLTPEDYAKELGDPTILDILHDQVDEPFGKG
jgi:ankyrin repeat protein